jgi:hypothetical protein
MVAHRHLSEPYRWVVTLNDLPNKRTASTTWEWRRVKIRTPPSGPAAQPPKGSSPPLSSWPRREALTITVHHRGGAESWWEIRARGRVWRRPGHHALEDVLGDVYAGRGGKRPRRT